MKRRLIDLACLNLIPVAAINLLYYASFLVFKDNELFPGLMLYVNALIMPIFLPWLNQMFCLEKKHKTFLPGVLFMLLAVIISDCLLAWSCGFNHGTGTSFDFAEAVMCTGLGIPIVLVGSVVMITGLIARTKKQQAENKSVVIVE